LPTAYAIRSPAGVKTAATTAVGAPSGQLIVRVARDDAFAARIASSALATPNAAPNLIAPST
jgi:hypothetical protein